jgi:hypothetical protein
MKKLHLSNFVSLLFLIICFGCSKKDATEKQKKIEAEYNLINICSIERQTPLDGWTDKGSFWLLRFEPNKVIYEFNPSCEYWFSSKIVKNEIIFLWEKNMNCSFNSGLSQKFKNIKNPIIGL